MSTTFKALGAIAAMAALMFVGAPAGAETTGDPYTLNTCAVSGKELGSMGDPIVLEIEGRELKLCCAGCEKPLKNDTAKYLEAVDAKMVEQQDADYPLDTCVISGKALDSKGDPVDLIVNNRHVKVCCGGCVKPASSDAEATIAKLDEAVIAKQNETYKATKCVVSGKDLGSMGDPVNLVVANRLVKICCAGCEKPVMKDPVAAIAKSEG